METIVEARDIGGLPYTAVHWAFATIHTLCAGTCAVEFVDCLLEKVSITVADSVVLLGYLVANAPHHDGRVVAVDEDEVGEVALPPGFARAVDRSFIDLFEEAAVSIFALGIDPHVHRFGHDHHTHFVADVHLPRCWHVV